MKYFLLTIFFVITLHTAHAARVIIVAPEVAPPGGDAFPVVLMLDTEGKTVSGVSGNFSFDEEFFTVDSISTDNSIVSPWIVPPQISKEYYFDSRTHITFEGIFAGGHSGVKSPYYNGEKEGSIITVFLRPKRSGETNFVLDSLSLRAFNEEATELPISDAVKNIIVRDNTKITKKEEKDLVFVPNEGLTVMIAKSELVASGALHLVVDDKEQNSSIAEMYVAETKSSSIDAIAMTDWHKARNPYILVSQNRSSYIHVKIIYSNGTYTLKTIEPVDNNQTSSTNSHILLGIGMLIVAFGLYAYTRKKVFTRYRQNK